MGSSFPLVPEQASTFAEDVDNLFYLLTGLSIFFTVLVLALLLFFAIHYRRGSMANRDRPSTGYLRLELGWSIAPLIIGCFVYVVAAKPFTYVYRPPADAMEIFVIGKRWMWHLQHTNGIRENNELHVPVGRAIKLTMISQDVIHGFSVPAFRMKRDVLPGRYNTCWFQATKPGKYHLFCTEYCGTNHSEMTGWVYVMEPADFQEWQSRNGNREVAQNQTLEQEGASLFDTLACGNCHGQQDNVHGPSLYGLFGRQRKLTNGKVVVADDDYIRESIVNPHAKVVEGYQDIMESYPTGDGPGLLNEEQLLSLVAYIKTLGTGGPTASLEGGASKPAGKRATTTGAAPKRTTQILRPGPPASVNGDRNGIVNRPAEHASVVQSRTTGAFVDTNR